MASQINRRFSLDISPSSSGASFPSRPVNIRRASISLPIDSKIPLEYLKKYESVKSNLSEKFKETEAKNMFNYVKKTLFFTFFTVLPCIALVIGLSILGVQPEVLVSVVVPCILLIVGVLVAWHIKEMNKDKILIKKYEARKQELDAKIAEIREVINSKNTEDIRRIYEQTTRNAK